MTPAAILDRLAELGITARVEADALLLRPFSTVPPDLLAAAWAHKAGLPALLQPPPSSPSPAVPSCPARGTWEPPPDRRPPASWLPENCDPNATGDRCACCHTSAWWPFLRPDRSMPGRAAWLCAACHQNPARG